MQARCEQSQGRFANLIEVTQRLVGVSEPEELLQVILASALRLFAADACSIALIDEPSRQLTFAFTLGGAKVEEFRVPPGQGIIGWVSETGQGVVCNDVSQDPRFFGTLDRKTGFRTKAILCAPLQQGDRTIGAIEVLNTTASGGFSHEDLELLHAFGGLATPAIPRTKTFTTVRNAKVAFQERARSPARSRKRKGNLNWPTAGRFSWMRLAISRCISRPSCCGSSRKKSSNASGA